MTDRTGQQLGNYLLTRSLGQGGFAEVYQGEHIYLKTQAAIKVLLTQLASDDIEEFLKEARTIANLIHPNIVRVLEFGIESKTPFLVMDYAPNGTLRQRHPKGSRLQPEIIVPYLKQIAAGLQYAHDQKLIHRDIKPENLLVGRHNEILLSDFGIALVAQSSRYQSTQDVVGTVAYMSPEQIQGKPRPASDQYSLGIVVYEWLSGSRPFHGSFTELCTQHMFATPPPLRGRVPTISSEIEEVVNTALAKDPKQRFGSVQAFANALDLASQNQKHITADAMQRAYPVERREPMTLERDSVRTSSSRSDPSTLSWGAFPPLMDSDDPSTPPLLDKQYSPPSVASAIRLDEEEQVKQPLFSRDSLRRGARLFSPVLVPLPFALMIFFFSLPTELKSLPHLPVSVLIIVLLALTVTQGTALYFARSNDKLWTLYIILGYALFLVVGMFALFGRVGALLMFVVLLFISIIATSNYWPPANRVKIWSIDKRQKRAIFIGSATCTVLLAFALILLVLSDGFINVTFSIACLVFLSLAFDTPLFFGSVFGPWAGLLTASVGPQLGVIAANILLSLLGRSSGAFSVFLNFYSQFWPLALGLALASFISGLAVFKFKGRYNIRRSLGFSILGISIGTLLGFLGIILVAFTIPYVNWHFLVSFLLALLVIIVIYIAVDLLLLPTLLVSYHKIAARRKQKTTLSTR